MRTCAKCGTVCEDSMKFCSNCGEPFREAEDILTAAEEKTEIPELTLEAPASEAFDEDFSDTTVLPEGGETVPVKVPQQYDVEEQAEIFPPAPEPEIPKDTSESIPVKPAAAAPAAGAAAWAAADSGKRPEAEPKRPKKEKPVEEKPVRETRAERKAKPISLFAVLSLIFAIIGVFAGGYACLLSFLNIGIALIFFVPAALGIVFGLLGLHGSGSGRPRRGRILAWLGIIIGALAVVLWVIGIIYLRTRTNAEFGTTDLMSVIRLITTSI